MPLNMRETVSIFLFKVDFPSVHCIGMMFKSSLYMLTSL